jgi:beta-galactosidase
MENNHSFSMYMGHGGSNFGLWAGANAYKNKSFDYRGHVTSYDYAAPINEQGSATDKFYNFRNLSKIHATW